MATTMTRTGWTREALEARVVRYADLKPCYNAFVDCRTPGSEAKENFTIIGPGVSENPAQHVHIAEPHGYNIGGARQPPNCVNSQHSHDTAEVFVAHTGTWRFDLGEHGDDAQVVLHPGDLISLPTKMFRGFTNIGDDVGYLWAVLGQDNPGRVTWAPRVFELAKDYGLVLLENGSLIDTAAGHALPEGAKAMAATTPDQVAALARYSAGQAERLVVRDSAGSGHGIQHLIGPQAPLDWDHGFVVTRIDIDTGEAIDSGGDPDIAQVVFVHRGTVSLPTSDGDLEIGEGDTISLPAGQPRDLRADSDATIFAVHAVA